MQIHPVSSLGLTCLPALRLSLFNAPYARPRRASLAGLYSRRRVHSGAHTRGQPRHAQARNAQPLAAWFRGLLEILEPRAAFGPGRASLARQSSRPGHARLHGAAVLVRLQPGPDPYGPARCRIGTRFGRQCLHPRTRHRLRRGFVRPAHHRRPRSARSRTDACRAAESARPAPVT